jgi:hypothetical protein
MKKVWDADTVLLALAGSVALQSFYAGMLNMYDGGTRRQYSSPGEYIQHLVDVGLIPNKTAQVAPESDRPVEYEVEEHPWASEEGPLHPRLAEQATPEQPAKPGSEEATHD